MSVVYFSEVKYNVENSLIKENSSSLNCLWVNSDKAHRQTIEFIHIDINISVETKARLHFKKSTQIAHFVYVLKWQKLIWIKDRGAGILKLEMIFQDKIIHH